jgi:hypothetical protein
MGDYLLDYGGRSHYNFQSVDSGNSDENTPPGMNPARRDSRRISAAATQGGEFHEA